MTYKEAKSLLLKTIDEAKPQIETLDKIRDFFNAGQREIALYYPICKSVFYEDNDEKCLPDDCFKVINITYQGKSIAFIIQNKKIICSEDSFTLEYASFPKTLPEKPLDDCILQTQEEAIKALPDKDVVSF